jgi:hypothetical protein
MTGKSKEEHENKKMVKIRKMKNTKMEIDDQQIRPSAHPSNCLICQGSDDGV